MKRVIERKSPHNIGNHGEKIIKRKDIQASRRPSRSFVRNFGKSKGNVVIVRDRW